MAFSAQTDHGQNERKDAVLCEIGKETSRDKTKVCTCSVDFNLCSWEAVFPCKLRGRDCTIIVRCFSIQKL